MKKNIFLLAFAAITTLTICSCNALRTGAGGYDTGMGVDARGRSYNSYDLVPIGDRITYTIDISTPEGKQKLYKLSLSEAKTLAETEASRKFNCDRPMPTACGCRKTEELNVSQYFRLSRSISHIRLLSHSYLSPI